MKKYSTKEVAKILGVCHQRIFAKLKQGHFPGSHHCECGRSILIPEHDVLKQPKKRNDRYDKSSSDSPPLDIDDNTSCR